MPRTDDRTDDTPPTQLATTIFLLGFGLALLAFLSAIERPEWFHIRPATGTAVAMGHAAEAGVPAR